MYCNNTVIYSVNNTTYNYENNQQDALYRLIYYSKSAVHVSGDVFAHHQEHMTVFTVETEFQLIREPSRQQLG